MRDDETKRQMAKAIAGYRGPVTKLPPGKAKGYTGTMICVGKQSPLKVTNHGDLRRKREREPGPKKEAPEKTEVLTPLLTLRERRGQERSWQWLERKAKRASRKAEALAELNPAIDREAA